MEIEREGIGGEEEEGDRGMARRGGGGKGRDGKRGRKDGRG